jgi:hypothetical protein
MVQSRLLQFLWRLPTKRCSGPDRCPLQILGILKPAALLTYGLLTCDHFTSDAMACPAELSVGTAAALRSIAGRFENALAAPEPASDSLPSGIGIGGITPRLTIY